MNYTSRVCKLVILGVLAALSVLAPMPTSALAEWLVSETYKEVRVEQHESHGWLLVPSKALKVLCETITTLDAKILFIPASGVLVIIHFEKCTTFSNEKESVGCTPKEPIVVKAEGTLIEHNASIYVLLTPDDTVNNRFTRIDFPGATCALPDTNITGSITLECLNLSLEPDDCSSDELSHLFTQSSLGLGDQLLYGVSAATLDGVGEVRLVSDEAWSAHL